MSNNPLIPVLTGTIAGKPVQLVNARELHSFLGIGKMFANWIKDRIKQYDFQENQDYICVAKTGNVENRGFQPIDYHLSLDMAKELSMVERNAKGKQARRYFIECERLAIEASRNAAPPLLTSPTPKQRETLNSIIELSLINIELTKRVLEGEYIAKNERTKPMPKKPDYLTIADDLELDSIIDAICSDFKLASSFKIAINLRLFQATGVKTNNYTKRHQTIIADELNQIITTIQAIRKNNVLSEINGLRLLVLDGK